MARDGYAKLLPFIGVVGRVLREAVGQSDATGSDEEFASIKSFHRRFETHAWLSSQESIVFDITFFEHQVANGGAVLPHLALRFADLQTFGAGFDEKRA